MTQLYLRLPADLREVVERLGRGWEEVMAWMRVTKWRLNPNVVLLVGTRISCGKRICIDNGWAALILKDHVHSLRVLLDPPNIAAW